jgi:hypothetical protein
VSDTITKANIESKGLDYNSQLKIDYDKLLDLPFPFAQGQASTQAAQANHNSTLSRVGCYRFYILGINNTVLLRGRRLSSVSSSSIVFIIFFTLFLFLRC